MRLEPHESDAARTAEVLWAMVGVWLPPLLVAGVAFFFGDGASEVGGGGGLAEEDWKTASELSWKPG